MNRGKYLIGLSLLALAALLLVSCRVADVPTSPAVAAYPANQAPLGPSPAKPTAAAPAGPVAPKSAPTKVAPTNGPAVPPTQDPVRRITVAEAKSLLDSGQAIIVDARSAASYGQKHVTGAISMPSGDVPARYAELPQDKLVIFYCT